MQQEKIDGFLSYTIGGSAMTVPMLINNISTGLQFLTMLGGFVIVIFRLIHEYRLYKKNK